MANGNITMPKGSLNRNRSPRPIQTDVSPDVYRESADQIVEMAAEQFADLLWRHWLYMQKLKKKGSTKPDS